MSLQNHLVELENRHRELDLAIDRESRLPSRDELQLTGMKRRKLRLKDEIERLKSKSH